jgi:hypothetical protein
VGIGAITAGAGLEFVDELRRLLLGDLGERRDLEVVEQVLVGRFLNESL